MSKKSDFAKSVADGAVKLFEEDEKGRPAYKSPAVITSSVTTILEAISTYFSLPGLGSAISLVLATIFRKKLDNLGQKEID